MKRKVKITDAIVNIIYYAILIPLLALTVSIVIQSIRYPDKIPNIFGYKMFMVLDEKMDEHIDYGDLVFTKNIDTKELKKGDLVAFRKENDIVIIHEIVDISEKDETTIFEMKIQENEVLDAKNVKESQIEGIVVNKIPKIGLIIMFVQEPINLVKIIAVIIAIGAILYFIAKKLDEKNQTSN